MPETYTSGFWVAKPGEEDDFVAAWREFAAWARTHEGCGMLRLVRNVEQPARFMSFAPWASFEAQRAWKEEDEFPERIGRVRRHTDEFVPSTWELVEVIG